LRSALPCFFASNSADGRFLFPEPRIGSRLKTPSGGVDLSAAWYEKAVAFGVVVSWRFLPHICLQEIV
jgi:hypothetical protein